MGGNLGVIVVRVCEPAFQCLPHSYTWPIIQNVDLFIYCPLIFVPIYCWLLDKYHSQFIEYQENKQPRKISEQKICVYTKLSEKWGLSHRNPEKIGSFILLFIEKRGPVIYLAALKKGAIRHAHPYYAIYRSYPPPPPPLRTPLPPPPTRIKSCDR